MERTPLKPLPPHMTVAEQIENLKSIGLAVSDEAFAAGILSNVSYFRLIKGFSLGLKEANANYHDGVTFEGIVELYRFNGELRKLVFALIETIEVTLRCRLSNYICEKYGVLGYEIAENFYDKEHYRKFIEEVERDLKRSSAYKDPFIKNFQNRYEGGKVPFYALVEVLSFGALSKFYKNMKTEDKKAIAEIYEEHSTFLESYVENLVSVRNICAHYGNLYNAILPKAPKIDSEYKKQIIALKQADKNADKRFFVSLLAMKRLLPGDGAWLEFVEKISRSVSGYTSVDIRRVGFPPDWEHILKSTAVRRNAYSSSSTETSSHLA